MADCLAQLVQDAEVYQELVGQRALHLLRVSQDSAALALADSLDDCRRQLHVLPRDQANLLCQLARRGRLASTAAEDKDALPDLNMIARLERRLTYLLVVEKRAVGTADVAEIERAIPRGAKEHLGVASRDLGVRQANGIASIAANADHGGVQLKLLALIGALDDDQL